MELLDTSPRALGRYAVEVLFNAVVIWKLLNWAARRQSTVLFLEDSFSFWKCLAASALLFAAAFLAASVLIHPMPAWDLPEILIIKLNFLFLLFKIGVGFGLWYYLSLTVLKLIFRNVTGHRAIFVLYIMISVGVEWILRNF